MVDNQHKKISGFRDLSQEEFDLMNEIKAAGAQLDALVERVYEYRVEQGITALEAKIHGFGAEFDRLNAAEPHRWLTMARTDLQVGIMKLARAVAQPGGF